MVYLATDESGQQVAIKEYLPDGMVQRESDGTVRPVSDETEKTFMQGMRYFFDEGRTLAGIRHPNVVEVNNFFRANETVYMVMKYEEGKTLQSHIHGRNGRPMRENFIRGVFIRLLNGLREIHARRLLHFDIKPSNIYIRKDGSPVLIDFGAARQALGTLEYVPMYTPGFAAPEQYEKRDRQGPWTDLYGIGASMYACLAGSPPPPADARLQEDTMVPASTTFAGLYSEPLLNLTDRLLLLSYTGRPQSVFAVQKELMQITNPVKLPPVEKTGLMDRIIKTLNKPL